MKRKNLELEYLRAAAILLVLVAHIPAMLRWEKSWWAPMLTFISPGTGVDLFFCISGYIVSKSLVDFIDEHRAKGTHWLAITSFWVRRAFRLLPSAWFWMVAFIVLGLTFNSTGTFGDLKTNLRAATAILTYTANFAQSKGLMGGMGHYWSLALEEQFYLVLPVFLLLVQGRWRWQLIASVLLVHMYIGSYEPWSPIWRINSALYGVLVYFLTLTPQSAAIEPVFLRKRSLAIAVSMGLIILMAAIPSQLYGMSFAAAPFSVTGAILVWLTTFQRGYILPIPHAGRLLGWIGSRSYSLYLTHIPAFFLTHEIWSRYALAAGGQLDSTYTLRCAVTGLALAFALAELSYRRLEMPLRDKGIQISRKILGLPQASPKVEVAEPVETHVPAGR